MNHFFLARSLRAFAAMLAAALVAACGGSSDSASPTAFFGVVSSSVALGVAARVAASADGSTWLAWTEGDFNQYSLIVARINGVGIVGKSTVTSNVAGALRDLRITMVGTTPVLSWRHYGAADDVTVNAVSLRSGGAWQVELAAAASGQGDVTAASLPAGLLSLSWARLDAAGRFELVASRRALDGSWSTPTVIRTGAAGMVLLRSGQASDGAGGLMAIWSESPDPSGSPPQTLLSSPYDQTLAAWGAALTVDAGQRYYQPAIASAGAASWVAAWLSGERAETTTLESKRFAAGAWTAAAVRVDQGQDAFLRELVLAGTNHRVHVAWTGLAASVEPGAVRAAAFDAPAGTWSAPSLVATTPRGYPDGLVLRADGQGAAAAAWNVSQGDGNGPFLSVTDTAGNWQAASQLDPGDGGTGVDLALFSASDIATTWYRLVPGALQDVVVRRLR